MYKQNGENMSNGIKFTLKKEGNSNTCYNVNELWRYYAKWNKWNKDNTIYWQQNKYYIVPLIRDT